MTKKPSGFKHSVLKFLRVFFALMLLLFGASLWVDFPDADAPLNKELMFLKPPNTPPSKGLPDKDNKIDIKPLAQDTPYLSSMKGLHAELDSLSEPIIQRHEKTKRVAMNEAISLTALCIGGLLLFSGAIYEAVASMLGITSNRRKLDPASYVEYFDSKNTKK